MPALASRIADIIREESDMVATILMELYNVRTKEDLERSTALHEMTVDAFKEGLLVLHARALQSKEVEQ